MALHAAAVEILIEKARFDPQIALGVTEAIEATIMHAQLLTIPVLDARMQELRAETRISLMGLESKLDAKLQELKSDIGRARAELEVKMEATKAGLEVKMEAAKAELEVKIEAIKAELVRWVFLAMLGNVALSAGVGAVLKYLG